MGQYHKAASLTKWEYLEPHGLGDGLKLMEMGMSGPGGIGSALILLTACSNGRGGGDFREEGFEDVVGRWTGDRIAVIGDYSEQDDIPGYEADVVYDLMQSRDNIEKQIQWYWKMIGSGEVSEDQRFTYLNMVDRIEKALAKFGPLEDITPRVKEMMMAEGYLEYSGEPGSWISRKLAF